MRGLETINPLMLAPWEERVQISCSGSVYCVECRSVGVVLSATMPCMRWFADSTHGIQSAGGREANSPYTNASNSTAPPIPTNRFATS
jgi:hypothetical protein